jgi:hypothetical protein
VCARVQALSQAAVSLVNDLDLTVVSAVGSGSAVLARGNDLGSGDRRNNVEQCTLTGAVLAGKTQVRR